MIYLIIIPYEYTHFNSHQPTLSTHLINPPYHPIHPLSLGVLDCTNHTHDRRKALVNAIRPTGAKILFIEVNPLSSPGCFPLSACFLLSFPSSLLCSTSCQFPLLFTCLSSLLFSSLLSLFLVSLYWQVSNNDARSVEENYRNNVKCSPDYEGIGNTEAELDYRRRVDNYQSIFEPIDADLQHPIESKWSYFKCDHFRHHFVVHRVRGHVLLKIVHFIMNMRTTRFTQPLVHNHRP